MTSYVIFANVTVWHRRHFASGWAAQRGGAQEQCYWSVAFTVQGHSLPAAFTTFVYVFFCLFVMWKLTCSFFASIFKYKHQTALAYQWYFFTSALVVPLVISHCSRMMLCFRSLNSFFVTFQQNLFRIVWKLQQLFVLYSWESMQIVC